MIMILRNYVFRIIFTFLSLIIVTDSKFMYALKYDD